MHTYIHTYTIRMTSLPTSQCSNVKLLNTYPHHHCALVIVVKCGLPWRPPTFSHQHITSLPHHSEAMSTYPHYQCPLVTAVKCGLPWRSWVMPKDCWEDGVLRETQSRVSDSMPNTSPTPSPHQPLGFEFKIRPQVRNQLKVSKNRFMVNITGLQTW